MTRVTQPIDGRGKKLLVAVMAAAMCALLAFTPFAPAASDPVASGTTTVTLNKGFFKKLKKNGVKVLKVSPASVKSRKVTLPVSAGSVDPLTGQGYLEHSGGIKFKAGKKTATLKSLILDTTKSSLSGKVAGKSMKIASVSGLAVTREGFGAKVTIGKLKLTGKAVKQLNKKLGFSGKKKGKAKKQGKRASASKAAQKPFKGNQVIGSSASAEQPKTVAVLPSGAVNLTLSASALGKLTKVGPETPPLSGNRPFAVKLSTVSPTTVVSPGPPPTLGFPIGGGTIGPTASAGIVQTLGGIQLIQNLEGAPPPGTKGTTTLTMGNIWLDLGAKTATVEVTIENPKTAEANLGNIGRTSIADIQLTGATIVADPTNRTVSVQNASATLQAVTAETLNSVFITPIEKATGQPQEKFAAGDPLGTFSFTAQTQ